jgi:phosphonate transport system substrate-binding protein
LALKTDTSESVAPGEVGYLFSIADVNIAFWVLRKKVVAGALDDSGYKKEADSNLNSLKVIEKSNPVPRHIVSYRADLPPKLVARIKEILTGMDQSEEGKKALKDFENTSKFDVISDQAMAPFLKSMKHFNSELGVK